MAAKKPRWVFQSAIVENFAAWWPGVSGCFYLLIYLFVWGAGAISDHRWLGFAMLLVISPAARTYCVKYSLVQLSVTPKSERTAPFDLENVSSIYRLRTNLVKIVWTQYFPDTLQLINIPPCEWHTISILWISCRVDIFLMLCPNIPSSQFNSTTCSWLKLKPFILCWIRWYRDAQLVDI